MHPLKTEPLKKGIILIALLQTFVAAFSQTKETAKANAEITGKVIDSITQNPLEFATITLYKQNDKKAINGSITDNSGKFTVTNVAEGSYKVVIDFIGYDPSTVSNVAINQKHEKIDLNTIILHKKTQTLQGVTVTTHGRVIENKIDKLVFNAERDITSQTGVATDVLKKVPQVSVDVDGNVELAGSSSIRFLINGKPSTLYGSSISDVLQSIPANQIKSIEVITNPGAKYDAQGLGGIINIVLKKNNAEGINTSIGVTVGTRMENGSLNFNARKGKFGVNAFFSGNARLNSETPSSSDRLSSDTASKTMVELQQNSLSHFKRSGYESSVGFDWTLKEKNSFSGSLSFDHFGYNGSGYTNQSQLIYESTNMTNPLSQMNVLNNSTGIFSEHTIDADLSYKRTFTKEDQELDIDINTSKGNNLRGASNEQFLLPQDSLYYGTNSNNPGKEKETQMTIDYTHPITKNIFLGTGGKITFYDIKSTSNVLMYNVPFDKYTFDTSLSNYLDYHQKVYAFYSEISFPVAKIVNAKIGGRYERTKINSFYSDAGQQGSTPGYNTFVPSVFFSKSIGEKQTLKLSYSKRIERPDYGDLNPYINTSDPKNISVGNPNLKPEIGNRYELGYSRDLKKSGSFMVSLFYQENKGDIQPFVIYYPTFKIGDSTYTNVSVSTRENIGVEKNAGVSFFGDIHFTTKFNLRTNLFFFHRHIINAIDKGYNSTSFNYRFNLNASYQFTNTLAAEFFGNFNSARHEAQGSYPSFTTYSMAIRKQFWNKKGSLALTAVNPFSKYITQQTYLYGPNFNVTNNRKIPFRSIGLNFTWKFGKLEFKKDKEVENNPNLSMPAVQ